MLNNYIIPIIVIIIIFYGFIKKCDIYDDFIEGALEGLKTLIDIIPAILAMIFAVNVFIGSGILNIIGGHLTLAVLYNVYKIHGVDSFLGFLASVIQGATDTTIYVLALYFSSIKIKKTRYALWVGLFADFCGITAAFILARFFF